MVCKNDCQLQPGNAVNLSQMARFAHFPGIFRENCPVSDHANTQEIVEMNQPDWLSIGYDKDAGDPIVVQETESF